jgi:hypothetical protein
MIKDSIGVNSKFNLTISECAESCFFLYFNPEATWVITDDVKCLISTCISSGFMLQQVLWIYVQRTVFIYEWYSVSTFLQLEWNKKDC